MSRAGVIDVKLKRMFLDTKLVEGLIGKKSAKAIRVAMSRVRLRAMHSMKKKGRARKRPAKDFGKAFETWMQEVMQKHPSPPGTPPYVYSDREKESLRNIWFALDVTGGNMQGVVGPLLLNKHNFINGVLTKGTVPSLHEHGGTAGIQEVLNTNWITENGVRRVLSSQWVRAGMFSRRKRAKMPQRVRTANYQKRPFMQPALEKEAPKFPQLWSARAA